MCVRAPVCPRPRPSAAKNLILAGPRSVTLFDPTLATLTDQQANYYISAAALGTRRDAASLPKLRELNAYVITDVLGEAEVTEAVVARFHVVVFTTPQPQALLERLSAFCHSPTPAIGFIASAVAGTAGYGRVPVCAIVCVQRVCVLLCARVCMLLYARVNMRETLFGRVLV